MAINAYGQNTAIYGNTPTKSIENVEDKTALKNSDFMTLLLVELQHQDPTEPMDSEKILTQTSQLATLESTDNTNNALADLAAKMGTSDQFSSIAAIGKMADIGSNAISHEEGKITSFEMHFPSDIEKGTVEIVDTEGNIVQTLPVGTNSAGTYKFDWDGTTSTGASADSNVYYVNAAYTDPDGNNLTTRMGAYPIESVKFDNGNTLVKLGSSYVPLENIKEVY